MPFSWTVTSSAGGSSSTDPTSDSAVAGAGAELLPKDLQLDADGDLLVAANDLQLARGRDALVQDLRSRLLLVRGEYFLDLDAGLPYFEDVFRKNPNLPAFRAELRDAIEETPAIRELTSLTLTESRADRLLSVSFDATTDLGELGAVSVPLLPEI